MNLKKPLQAKSTGRVLKAILPESFKMVSDPTSNGYKYVNLLYGVEFDNAINALQDVYNNSFISTYDCTLSDEIYDVSFSGIPNDNYLNRSGVPIKITNENEFYNGSPTRLTFIGSGALPFDRTYTGTLRPSGLDNSFSKGFVFPCWSAASGVTGLEYFRSHPRGSGYILVTTDLNQVSGFYQDKYPAFVIDVGTNFQDSGDYLNVYGLSTGIESQDFLSTDRYEVLQPISQQVLSGKYPEIREIIDDSGVIRYIDHYTPYHGWMRNETGEIKAVVDYPNDYYFDEDGKKIYYRTTYNNPYGSGNYTTAYLTLENVPISGTLVVKDIDILDISGNAIEIPASGKSLYYYKSTKMFENVLDPQFDPIYLGYDAIVPSGRGFSANMEGSGAALLKTTSWGYLHNGAQLDPGTLSWTDGSGDITNLIYLSGYHGKYSVEYKYKTHEKVKYVTSLESDGIISQHTVSPVYTTSNASGDIEEIDYEFTQDPSVVSSKVLTFDGLKVRPNKQLARIDFNIPILYEEGPLNNYLSINTNRSYIGYTKEFVPQITNFRNYIVNCYFDATVSGNLIEQDISDYNNDLSFSGTNIYKVNYDTYYGKKILTTGSSYYYLNNVNVLYPYTYFRYGCKILYPQTCHLMELRDATASGYVNFNIDNNGYMNIQSNGYEYNTTTPILFNTKEKDIILKYVPDDLSTHLSVFTLYYKEKGDFGYRVLDLTPSIGTEINVTSTYLHLYKNFDVDIGRFCLYYEVQ
jgi:hypothetical protein